MTELKSERENIRYDCGEYTQILNKFPNISEVKTRPISIYLFFLFTFLWWVGYAGGQV